MSWIGGLMRGRPPGAGTAAAARRACSSPSSTSSPSVVVADVDVGARRAWPPSIGLPGSIAALAEVLRLDVADVQKAVAADAEIDERRLDARLQVDDAALVDVADVIVLAGPLDVELFQDSVLNDRDPAFFRLRDVDQHFLLHSEYRFLCSVAGRMRSAGCGRMVWCVRFVKGCWSTRAAPALFAAERGTARSALAADFHA